MISKWSDSVTLPRFPHLEKDVRTDVLIIGGGLAGILCAYMLKDAGVNYILAEAKTIGSGITKNTTAKITSQHGLIYHKLAKSAGAQNAALYLRANQEAVAIYKKLCGDYPCDFKEMDSYVYSTTGNEALEKEVQTLLKLGFPAELVRDIPLPFPVTGAVRFPGQAQFHPLKFLGGIAEDLNIYENTMIKDVAPHRAVTDYGDITADKIIVATHFPFINRHGSYFLKMYQQRSYVLALEHAADVNGMYVDAASGGLSFRNCGGLLLFGGGGHRTGKTGGGWDELRKLAGKYYPNAKELYHWAAQDCMTLDSVPYVGQYSKNTPGLYVATGFNKWGMTGSMVSARLLTSLVMGDTPAYSSVFSPSRSMLKPQLAANAIQATANILTPTVPRCPHMGCALKWNPQEHSWDCPCHGSRFAEDGGLIDNPSLHSLKRR